MPRVRYRTETLNAPFGSRLARFFTGGETWTHHHLTVFALTFFSFAFVHATRKTLSLVKPSMIQIWTHNTTVSNHTIPPLFPSDEAASEFLAFLDSGFLIAYALGLFAGGMLGDRYNPRSVLTIGMILSALTVFAFGYGTEYFRFYSKPLYAFLWIMNGLFQSVAWPTEVSIMGHWFGHNSRGAIFGLWSGCGSVGNIIGTLISSHVIKFGFEYAFAVNAVLLFVFAIVVRFAMPVKPHDVGLPDPHESDDLDRVIEEEPQERPKPISFWRAWLLPGVIAYSLAYACLKLVNYGFFFWLPYYLHNHFGWSEADADALSTWYDVGGIIAAIIAGAASDHFATRTPIIVGMQVCSLFALYAYTKSSPSLFMNGLLLCIAGFFIGGPANMISGAVSADLGKAKELHGCTEALATVTGIVDGTGSTGAALGMFLIPSIQYWFGWNYVFYGFILMMACTTICLLPLLWRELRPLRTEHYRNDSDDEVPSHSLHGDEDSVRRRLLAADED